MRPILFHLGSIPFSAYFAMAAGGYLVASLLLTRAATRHGEDPVAYLDLAMVGGVAGFIGARLFHILFELPKFYLAEPLAIFKFWYGGFVLYGGVMIGTVAAYLFSKRRQLNFGLAADLGTPYLLLAIAIGRLGCFLAGCCYGHVNTLPWPLSVKFQMVGETTPQATPLNTPLWPTQIYCALLCIGIYFWLVMRREKKRWHGQLALKAVLLYASGRWLIEWLRADSDRGVYLNGWLSTSQLISLLILIAGGVWLRRGQKKYAPHPL